LAILGKTKMPPLARFALNYAYKPVGKPSTLTDVLLTWTRLIRQLPPESDVGRALPRQEDTMAKFT